MLMGGSVLAVSLLTGGSFMGGLAGGMSVEQKGEMYPFVGGGSCSSQLCMDHLEVDF